MKHLAFVWSFFSDKHTSASILLRTCGATACLFVASLPLHAQAKTEPVAHLSIDPSQIVSPVSPMLYGMMTEEINHAFDGGLYAELVANRTFRPTWDGIQHWTLVRNGEARGKMESDKADGPSKALPDSVKLTIDSASSGNEAGFSNSGYWGIPVKPHTTYHGSFYAKSGEGSVGPVTVKIVSDKTGAVLAHAQVEVHPGALESL